jgi:COMPASS component BRE2
METEPEASAAPKRETTPSNYTPISSLPQKRPYEEDHTPNVPSPLNPNNTNNNSPVSLPVLPTAPNPAATAAASAGTPERKGTPVKDEMAAPARSARTKKDSLKKRESKGGVDSASARVTPDPKIPDVPSSYLPARYRLGAPKPGDFEPAKGPVFTPHHTIQLPGEDRAEVEFCETSEQ